MANPATVDAIDTAITALEQACSELDAARAAASELTALHERIGRIRRLADAAQSRVAAEIARRSRAELGKDSLARKTGFRTASTMVATTTGISIAEAQRLIQVGEATAPRANLVGERLPAKHAAVAAAVECGALGVTTASQIIEMLDRVALRAGAERVSSMEKALVEAADGLRPDEVTKLILRAQAHLDPDGQEPRDRARRDARSLVIREDADGTILITARLDAASAAPVVTALEGVVTQQFRAGDRTAASDAPAPAETVNEPRTRKQLLADALVAICTHATGCDEVPTGPATTVVVRMSLDDLLHGTGIAQIDGIGTPVSAETARKLASDAEIIPCVLGGDGAVLDWGRARRLFTHDQKLALVERDGGCAFCGAPPGQTVVHHIRWWERDHGSTDLANGLLLCTVCHHRVHDDGWEIRIDGPGVDSPVWFIPPPWVDPARTPRKGGAARYRLAA